MVSASDKDADKAQGTDRYIGVDENPEAVDELLRKLHSHIQPAIDSLRWWFDAKQLIDAGGQANLMQQHTLMRNQSTGDGPDWVDREALRRKNGGTVMPRSTQQRGSTVDRAALELDMRRMIERRRAQLLPEYERRVRADGRPSADRWLREVAAEMGRRDGNEIRAKYGQ